MSLNSQKTDRVKVHFPGALDSHFSHVLEIREKMEPIDTFRVMDKDGKVLDPSLEPDVSTCLRCWVTHAPLGRSAFFFMLFFMLWFRLEFGKPSVGKLGGRSSLPPLVLDMP
jgi:hypothetical protein